MIKSTSVRSEDWSYVVDHGRSLGLSRVGDGTASLESQQGGWRVVVSYGMFAVSICCTPSNVFLQRRGVGSADDLRQGAGREGAAYHVSRSWLYVRSKCTQLGSDSQ